MTVFVVLVGSRFICFQVGKQHMRISNDQGKSPIGKRAWLIIAITLVMALLVLIFLRFLGPTSLPSQITASRFKTSSPNSQVPTPNNSADKKDAVIVAHQQGASSKEESELKREREEEMEREREEMERKRYDQPGEAAEYLTKRRLPEGEKELRPELYLEAVEKSRDLPQFSTLQNRLLPSQRESVKSGFNLANPRTAILQGWTSLGPGNIGGRTRALLVNPRTPDVMYAAGVGGGVWKTTDGGKSWQPLSDLLPTLSVCALAFDPANPETIYAGTGEGYYNADATRGAGIFRSFDAGNTWRRLEGTGTPEFYYVNDIVVSPNNSSRIYAATRSGIMRSLNGGVTWTAVVNEQSNGGCTDLAIRTDQTTDIVFAACGLTTNFRIPGSVQASIYRNDNAAGFGSWEVVYSEEGMARTSLAIAPSNQNVIYAVSSENGASGTPHTLHGVFRSTAGGEAGSWVKVNDGRSSKLNSMLFTNPIWAYQSECRSSGAINQTYAQGWFDNVIAVDPLNENIVWVGGIDLFRSDDGGVNWGMASFWDQAKTAPSRYVHADQHAIVFHPQFNGSSNRRMFVGNDGGIFRTENARAQTATGNRAPCSPSSSGVTWASLNAGYAVTQFYHGAAFPNGLRYLGGTQDNGVIMGSDTVGVNGWREVLEGDGGYVAVDPINSNIVYAETTWLSLMKSTDGGTSFRPATTNINREGFGFIVPFAMDPSDSNRLWIGGPQLWRTKNGAETWTPGSARLNGTVTAIAVAQDDGNFVLAGTDQGNLHRTTTGLNSTGDTIWTDLRPRQATVSSVAFDPTNRDIAYATYTNFNGKHVYRTLNGGLNWHAIDLTLPDIPVNCIIVDPTNPQRLYIGTDIGVYTSPDGGATWAVENTGFAHAPVEWLSVSSFGGTAHLFAFTRGRGAWRVPLGQVCSFALSPASQPFDAMGGNASVTVTASGNECSWTVENNTPWITISGETSARGNGTVAYSVTPNNDPSPRRGVITIAGKSFEVTQAGLAVSVSAASLVTGTLAPESIVTAFGAGMSNGTEAASGNQLPMNLIGTALKVRDQSGVERPSPLFFVSPNQINYQLPAGTNSGPASVTIFNGNDRIFSCQIQVSKVAPGLFTADGSGRGVPAGQALRFRGGASQSEPLFYIESGRVVSRPIDLGPDLGASSDQVFLVLYGTGFRLRSSLENMTAKLGGLTIPVLFAGAQGDYAGLDQVNLQIPRALIGRGEVDLVLIVDGQQSNVVRVNIK